MSLILIVLELKLEELEQKEKVYLDQVLSGKGDRANLSKSLSRTVRSSWDLAVEAFQRKYKKPVQRVKFPEQYQVQISSDATKALKRAEIIFSARISGITQPSRVIDRAFIEYKRTVIDIVRKSIQDSKQYAFIELGRKVKNNG